MEWTRFMHHWRTQFPLWPDSFTSKLQDVLGEMEGSLACAHALLSALSY